MTVQASSTVSDTRYNTLSDPRAVILKGMAKKLAEYKGREADFALCEYIETKYLISTAK